MSAWADMVLDLIFPKRCAGCGAEGWFCCPGCRKRLIAATPSCPVCGKRNFTGILCGPCAERAYLRRFFAPFSYRDAIVRELIHAYKYGGARELAELFANEIASFLRTYAIDLPATSILVPIPLHRSKERERGFNQARLLAEHLSRQLGLPTADALLRNRPTDSQTGTDSLQSRRENVLNAFIIGDKEAIAGKTVILIDDVSTSGATLGEAAKVLKSEAVKTVWAFALAKG